MYPCKYVIKISEQSYLCYDENDNPCETNDRNKATKFEEKEFALEEVKIMGIGKVKAIPYK